MTIDTLVDKYNNFVLACDRHHAVDDVWAGSKILNEICKYAKYLESDIEVLKAEIESLKCCGNCKHDNDTPTDTAEDHYCYYCENNNKWEKRL